MTSKDRDRIRSCTNNKMDQSDEAAQILKSLLQLGVFNIRGRNSWENYEMRSITDFLAFQSAGQVTLKDVSDADWIVFGEPMHASPEELIKELYILPIDEFLMREARRSVGNYVLVSVRKDAIRIITSPSYSGGYLYSNNGKMVAGTDLSKVLAKIDGTPETDPFGLSFYLSYAPRSNFNQLPFTTMFKDVSRIPPGSYVVVDAGDIVTYRSYLCDAKDAPRTFQRAMNEVMESVEGFYKRNPEKKAAVMFSGGIDSVAIYLGLREKLGLEKTPLFTMLHSASNGPDRALPVAAALGAKVEVINNTCYEKGQALEKILGLMDQDLPAFASPHLAFLGKDIKNTIVFSGQNFDALANITMEILQETQELGYVTLPAKRVAHTDNRELRQQRAFIRNLCLTDAYLEDPFFQKITASYFASLTSGLVADPEPGHDGILRGMLSSQFPNVLTKTKSSLDQVAHLNKEIERFRDYIGKVDARTEIDMMRHLTYSQFANKRITTSELGENVRPILLAMSGPLVSYFIGRKRGLSTASQPKREIYSYSRNLTGIPYRQMIKTKPTQKEPKHAGPDMAKRVDWFLEHAVGKLDPSRSRILGITKDENAHDYIQQIYQKTLTAHQTNEMTGYQKQLAIRIYNLEAVLEQARKG